MNGLETNSEDSLIFPLFFAKACIHAKAFYKVGGSGKNSVASSSPLTVGWLG